MSRREEERDTGRRRDREGRLSVKEATSSEGLSNLKQEKVEV
jgi:hypothetical protein